MKANFFHPIFFSLRFEKTSDTSKRWAKCTENFFIRKESFVIRNLISFFSYNMESITKKAKAKFLEMVNDFGSDPYHLLPHVPEAERWAKIMLKKYPQANEEVVLLSVWLHDIGHYPLPTEIDHAVRSEQLAKEFLEHEKYESEQMSEVLHCVRAHRCRDVMPKSLEAKLMAFVDSASHMTDTMYLDMVRTDEEGRFLKTYAKMERDMRDLSAFPEVQEKLAGLYCAWQNLLKEYEKIDLE